ncbi:GTP-binding protein [Stackebrandtia endophytica]|nr:GTP-binding protein [Stackebrandtia endophytica]
MNIRNIAVVGAAGSGKTTLIAGLSATAEGTSVPLDPDRPGSTESAVTRVRFGNVTVNLIDTPGHPDFIGARRAGLRAADAVLFVVAAGRGLDLAAQQLWEDCVHDDLPRVVAVTHLDDPRADVDETIALCRRLFDDAVVSTHLPLLDDDGDAVAGLIGLADQKILDYSSGPRPVVVEPEAVHLEGIAEARESLVAAILSDSDDESLMDRYIDGDHIGSGVLIAELDAAVARAGLHPAVPVDGTTGVGLDILRDLIVDACPSPVERPMPTVTEPSGDASEPLACDPAGPVVAEVLTTTMEVPGVSLLRVYSGTLRPGETVIICGAGATPSVSCTEPDHDDDLVAGDIRPITGLVAATGDTVSTQSRPLRLEHPPPPEPQFPVALVTDQLDEDTLAAVLTRLTAIDPTMRWEHVDETGQLLLWCMGDRHAEVTLDRLRLQGIAVDTVPVEVALRATFGKPANGTGRVVRQTAGHDEFAWCRIEVEPLGEGEGVEFVSLVDDQAIPAGLVTAVEAGVRDRLAHGLAGGRPVVDVKITLLDGEGSSVGSTEFAAAGALAVEDAALTGEPTLLEPIDHVTVTVADGYARIVRSDLSQRRGRVVGTDTDEHDRAVIHAEVPTTELRNYAIELREMTAGSGWFRRRLIHHQPMPSPVDD